MVVLHVFRDSMHDNGVGGVVQEWQFQRDVIIEQPHMTTLKDARAFKVLMKPFRGFEETSFLHYSEGKLRWGPHSY